MLDVVSFRHPNSLVCRQIQVTRGIDLTSGANSITSICEATPQAKVAASISISATTAWIIL